MTSRAERGTVLDSVTHLERGVADAAVIAASHCGLYSARYALRFAITAIILSDAGVGLDRAGIAGLAVLAEAGVAAATVAHSSARIGDGADCLARGLISHCNGLASKLGVTIGMPAREAAAHLRAAGTAARPPRAGPREVRSSLVLANATRPVVLADSASLVGPGDAGAVVVTGSHGGLLGGRSETAMKADVFAALFNDAAVGIDEAGIARLAALDVRGIAAATVDAWSARIGEARSTYRQGVISRLNNAAVALGASQGMAARDFVALAASA